MKRLLSLFVVLSVTAGLNSNALGDPIVLSLVPHPATIFPPQNVLVDVALSGLHSGGTDTLLAAFDMTIQFDPNVFQLILIGSTLGTGLGDPNDPLETVKGADIPTNGIFHFFEISLLADTELETLQPDNTLRLATLIFYAPGSSGASGTPSNPPFFISIANAILGDANGDLISLELVNARVAVPEPSSLFLLLGGLVPFGLVGQRIMLARRRARTQELV